MTPLHFACKNGCAEIFLQLIHYGALIDAIDLV